MKKNYDTRQVLREATAVTRGCVTEVRLNGEVVAVHVERTLPPVKQIPKRTTWQRPKQNPDYKGTKGRQPLTERLAMSHYVEVEL